MTTDDLDALEGLDDVFDDDRDAMDVVCECLYGLGRKAQALEARMQAMEARLDEMPRLSRRAEVESLVEPLVEPLVDALSESFDTTAQILMLGDLSRAWLSLRKYGA